MEVIRKEVYGLITYKSIIKVRTFMAKDIKTAEYKVVENIQRD